MCDFGTRPRPPDEGAGIGVWVAAGKSPSILVDTSGISAVLDIESGEHHVSCCGALRDTCDTWLLFCGGCCC